MAFFSYAYPPILTKHDWDQKKGIIAKAYGATGIGKQCYKMEKLYAKIDWNAVNASDQLGGFGNWQKDSYNAMNYMKYRAAAQTQMRGNIAKLAKEAALLHTLCLDTAVKFKGKTAIPSSSTKHVIAMANAAAKMAQDLGPKKMTELLTSMDDKVQDDVDNIIDGIKVATKRSIARHSTIIADLRKDLSAAGFNLAVVTPTRDIAQNIANLDLANKKGFGKKIPNADKVSAAIGPYANSNGSYLPNNADQSQVTAAINKLEKVIKAAQAIAATL